MPRDDWGSVRRKEVARRSLRSRKEPSPLIVIVDCPKCKEALGNTEQITFKDGTKHLKVTCMSCGRFIKWLSKESLAEQSASLPGKRD